MEDHKHQYTEDLETLAEEKNDEASVLANVEKLELYSDSYPFSLSLRITNFDGDASYKKFVNNCVALVRRCSEYKLWKDYIIDVLQVNTCMITHEEISQVTVEVHHHIPSLYTFISALINKNIETNKEFCSFDIARETMELHFKNKLGYVTLVKTIHEKFHNGHLDIPLSLVKGDYRWFIANYAKYMDPEDLETINSRLAVTESNCSWSKNNYPAAAEA